MVDINKMPDQERQSLEDKFIRAMRIARGIFGKDAFRKRYREDATRQPINKPLFESWSVNFNQLNDEQVGKLTLRKDEIRKKFIHLMGDPRFNEAVSYATGDPKKIRLRFESIHQIIEEVLS